MANTIRIPYYLHEEKWSLYDHLGSECLLPKDLPSHIEERLGYALYEVEVELEIDFETGNVKIVGAK